MKVFERGEYLQRIAKVKERMAAADIDVLLVAAPENIFYLSGYAGWSFYTPQLLLLAADETEPVLVLREMDVACAAFTAFVDAANVIGYPESFVGRHDTHPMRFVGQLIRQKGWDARRLGIEMDAHFFSPRAYFELAGSLPGARLLDAGLLINWVRIIKSPQEIACMRQAGTIAEIGMRTAIAAITPGRRECDVAADIYRAQISGTPEFGSGVLTGIAMPSGRKTSAPHLYWSDDVIEHGHATNVELGGCRHQYHVGLARTVFLGKPPQPLLDLASVVIEGLHAALAAVRPGVTCEAIEAAWRTVINAAGYEKTSRIGYSIGVNFQPSWVERTASLQPGDRTVLEPDMTFHLICGMWQGPHNMVTSETFRVTPGGYELFSRLEQRLFVKD